MKNSLQFATTQRAGLCTLVEIPATNGRLATIEAMAQHGLVVPGRRRFIAKGRVTWELTAEMADGSGWWPVTKKTYERISKK